MWHIIFENNQRKHERGEFVHASSTETRDASCFAERRAYIYIRHALQQLVEPFNRLWTDTIYACRQ